MHRKDEPSSKAVEDFIVALKNNCHEFVWYGSRASDLLRVHSIFNGFLFKLTHMLSKDHPLYFEGGGVDFDKREHEVLIKVTDISERWGRVSVLEERFNESSPLFLNAVSVFDSVWSVATILNSETRVDRKEYVSAVRSLTSLLVREQN
jgi:hypothetical protein